VSLPQIFGSGPDAGADAIAELAQERRSPREPYLGSPEILILTASYDDVISRRQPSTSHPFAHKAHDVVCDRRRPSRRGGAAQSVRRSGDDHE
jgi:hypothetical protein